MVLDHELIRRIVRRGDQEAADSLFDRYYREIYAFVYRQCGEKELAMDLTQEVMISAFQGLPGYDVRKASFRTWLYRVAANRITDYYRSRRHREAAAEIPLEEITEEPGAEESVLKQLERKDRIRQVMEIVSACPLSWIQIFELRAFEELPFAEIARELAVSESTVKTRWFTMIRRIRKELGSDDAD